MNIFRIFALLLVLALMPLIADDAAQSQPGVSTICQFNAGPRAGQTQNYAPMAPIPVGSACTDGAGSTGVVIPMSGPGTASQSGGAANPGMSTICRFNTGPRAGQTQDYAPMAPIAVGSSCTDGAGSTGVVIPMSGPGTASQSGGAASPGMSTICRFNTGPRAGQTQNYAPMAPIAVGSPCTDGAGSNGTVIPGS
jgi:hypothetical protein